MPIRILTTPSVINAHQTLFESIQAKYDLIVPSSREETMISYSGSDWDIALLPLDAIPDPSENISKGQGLLLCYVNALTDDAVNAYRRKEINEIWTTAMVELFLCEKIEKLHRFIKQSVSPASLFDFIHDLRTPLTVVYTTLEILLLQKRKDKKESFIHKINSCRAHLDRIKVMVTNSVETVRLQDIHIHKTEENITELIQSVLTSQSPRFESENKSLILGKSEVFFVTDRNIFKQMIHNMVDHYLLFADSNTHTPIIINKNNNQMTVEMAYEGAGWLEENELNAIFEKGERIVDRKKGIRYNKGFGFTYNRKMAALLGGFFDLIIDPVTFKHTLSLTLS
ncbi:MAG: HAMP domain-containing histidine kinase [Candidatus Aureabacteria bacterium]|nr:HAMP domain-containing histidine kinase [Candidatus Auribacterota bacterium]